MRFAEKDMRQQENLPRASRCGPNGFRVTPACSRVSRTRRTVATACIESPWTQIERIGVGRRLPPAVMTAPVSTISSTRAAASAAP